MPPNGKATSASEGPVNVRCGLRSKSCEWRVPAERVIGVVITGGAPLRGQSGRLSLTTDRSFHLPGELSFAREEDRTLKGRSTGGVGCRQKLKRPAWIRQRCRVHAGLKCFASQKRGPLRARRRALRHFGGQAVSAARGALESGIRPEQVSALP